MKKRPTFVGLFSFGGLWGKGPQWALPLLAHLAGGLMSRPAERPRRGLALASDRLSDIPPAGGVPLRPSRPQCGQRPRLRGPSGRR